MLTVCVITSVSRKSATGAAAHFTVKFACGANLLYESNVEMPV